MLNKQESRNDFNLVLLAISIIAGMTFIAFQIFWGSGMSTHQKSIASNADNEQKYYEIVENVQKKEQDNGLLALGVEERKIYLLDKFIMELNNGGFDQFFLNTEHAYDNELLAILKEIDLPFLVQLLEEGIRISSSVVAENERMSLLGKLDDSFYDHMDYEAFYAKTLRLFT